MEINEPYPPEITQAINTFVDRIEKALLQSGTPRAERTSVCAEVEAQIHTMIERRLEAGAELNLELVSGIIETMDQPEAYAKSVDPVPLTSSTTPPVPPVPPVPPATGSNRINSRPRMAQFRKFWDRPTRTVPGLDWVAIVGLSSTCLGLLFALGGILERSEFATVVGMLAVFAGVIASGISFWRITHSKGLLTGQRIASVGVLILPIVFANTILCVVLFGTPLGFFLGAVVLIGALVYANYRIARYALNWLAAYSAVAPETATVEEPIRQPDADSGQLPGVIASA